MDYIHIEGLSKHCSRLAFGMGSIRQLGEAELARFERFYETGGNVFDTAHFYRNSDKVLGEWMKMRNNRDNIVIMAKGAHHDDGSPGPRVNPEAITRDLLESLRDLDTDHVDLFALHRDDPEVEVGPIIEVLNRHIEEGRISAIGASNWTLRRLREANAYAETHGLIGFSFNSPNFSLAQLNGPRWAGCVSADEDALRWHTEQQIPMLSWSSQAEGFFTGKYSPDMIVHPDRARVYYNEGNWERYRRAKILAEEKNVTAHQIALAYVLNQAFPVSAIVAWRSVEQMEETFQAAAIELSPDEIAWLRLSRERRS